MVGKGLWISQWSMR